MLASRSSLGVRERRTRSRLIIGACKALPAFGSRSPICTYISFREEVETWDLVRELLREGRRVAAPAHFHGVKSPLVFAEVRAWEDLVPNHFGILQPSFSTARVIPTGDIPLFLVPGVMFDFVGGRLGYGFGFYDRALAEADAGALKVGLAFDFQLTERLPADPHDVHMDFVVTEKRIITAPSRDGAL